MKKSPEEILREVKQIIDECPLAIFSNRVDAVRAIMREIEQIKTIK